MGRGAFVRYIRVTVDDIVVTTQKPRNIRERKNKLDVVIEKSPPGEKQDVKSLVDEAQGLDDEQKIEINRRLLQSGGVLRDYDNNELLYPMNLAVLNVLQEMLKDAKSKL